MIKRIKLAFLFLVAGVLISVADRSSPPATAGSTDTDPVAQLRTLTQPLPRGEEKGGSDTQLQANERNPPADAGGSDRHPVASTTPRGLPARGPRSALGTDRDPPAQLRTLTQPLPEGEEMGTL